MRRSGPNPKANKNILRLAYAVAGVFACLVLYLGYFLQFESDSVINNAYNPRVDLLAQRVVPGGDSEPPTARCWPGPSRRTDGTERREYPGGSLYAHAVGYTGTRRGRGSSPSPTSICSPPTSTWWSRCSTSSPG